MRKILFVAALLMATPALSGTAELVKKYDDLAVKCQGGYGNDPATWRACDKRDSLFKKLKNSHCTYIPSPHPTGWDCK